MKRLIALIALGTCTLGSVAEAQQTGLDGVWRCQMSYTETDRRGKRVGGFTQEFQMRLSPNGQFYAQGMLNSPPYPTQFQAQGQWGVDGGILSAQGMSMGLLGQTQWGFAAESKGNMLMTDYKSPNPNGTPTTSHTLAQCTR